MRKRAEGFSVYGSLYEWTYNGNSVYTASISPNVGDIIYTSNGIETVYRVAGTITVYGEVASIVVGTTTYSRQLTGKYKWTYSGTSIFTYTYPPAVGDAVYDENGVSRTLSACDYKSPMMIMTKQEIVDEINKNAKQR